MDNNFQIKLKKVLALIALTLGLLFISWFTFDIILIYAGESKSTMPEPALNFSRLIIGIIIITISYTSLKWESWQTPNL